MLIPSPLLRPLGWNRMRRCARLFLVLLLAIGGSALGAAPAVAASPSTSPSSEIYSAAVDVPADEAAAQGDAANSAGSQPVYRFWSSKFDNAHFYTVSFNEALKLHAKDRNWAYEGLNFRVWPTSNGRCSAGTVATYRFWSSKFQSHFFTINAAEANEVRRTDPNWSYEGAAFCTTQSTTGTKSVYRFWSPKFGKHFYTANASEASKLRHTDPNWSYEGVAWRTPTSGRAVQQPTDPRPPQGFNCPAGYPIKGNHSSSGERIYHVPGGQFYERTNPEECFATERDAQAAGYRASKL